MNSKPMLFECLDCGETYLADNLCDGYNCPKCNGHVAGIGFIKEIEENMKDMEEGIKVTRDKIIKAKENGLIRKYNRPIKSKLHQIPFDGYIAELPFNKCICGKDYGSRKDSTVFTIHIDLDELTNIDKVARVFNEFVKTKRVGVIG